MISFYIIICFPLIFYFIAKFLKLQKNNLYDKFILIFLIFISTFRYDVGIDFPAYYNMFNQLKKITDSNLEKGFVLLMWISKQINGSFYFYLFVIAMINTILIYKTILFYNDKNKKLNYLIFFSYLGLGELFFYNLAAIRQSVAISIFLFSTRYIYEKKCLKYILMIFLAACFHKSSIFLFFFYFIINSKKIKIKISILYLVLLSLIMFRINNIVNILRFISLKLGLTRYISYFSGVNEGKGSTIGLIVRIFLILILIVLINKLSEKNRIVTKMIIINLVIRLISTNGIPILNRFLMFFSMFSIFYPIIFLENIKKKNTRIIFKFFYILMILLSFHRYYIKDINNFKGHYFLKYKDNYELVFFKKDIYEGKRFYRGKKRIVFY